MTQHTSDLRKAFEQRLESLDFPQSPENLYEPIRYMLSLGGKRIRPILTLMACELFGKSHEEAMNQALAVEIFHNFTLVHDDIMDSADMRRSLPTVHKKWDHNIALLSGDGMIVMAYQYLLKAPDEKLPKLAKVFSKVAMEVCEGQQFDMDYAQLDAVSIDQYMEMIRLKTAVLLGGAMQLGAIMAGVNKGQLDVLKEFAESMGLAFQIRDDYLDAFGDEAAFGKEIGGDIKEGKRTWMTLKSLEMARDDQRVLMLDLYNNSNLEHRKNGVMELYGELGVKALAEAEIERLSKQALDALDRLDGDERVKTELMDLVSFLVGREA